MIDRYADKYTTVNVSSVEKALFMLRDASLLGREIESYFSAHKLSQLRFLILIVIDREPDRGSLYAHEIALKLDVARPVASRTLQSLLDAKLIQAKADENDKRQKLISLSKAGKQMLGRVLPGYFELISNSMSETTDDVSC